MKSIHPYSFCKERIVLLPILTGLLLALHAAAIPQEENGPQAEQTSSQTEPGELLGTGTLHQVFDPKPADEQASEAWNRLQSPAGNSNSNHWPSETSATFKVIGHYSERFNNMDVERLVSAVESNPPSATQQAAHLPMNPDVMQRDLRPHSTNEDDEEKRMRALIRAVAASNPESDKERIKGLHMALTYLVMAGIIILIIFARR